MTTAENGFATDDVVAHQLATLAPFFQKKFFPNGMPFLVDFGTVFEGKLERASFLS